MFREKFRLFLTKFLSIFNKIFVYFISANFVINFTRGDLPRHFRSEVTSGSCVSEVCVSEATSTTFNSIVMDEDKVSPMTVNYKIHFRIG